MDFLSQSVILALIAASPWPGWYLRKLAPGEVAYAKAYLTDLLATLIALSAYLAIQSLSIPVRLFLAVLVGIAVLRFPVCVTGAIAGIVGAIALRLSNLTVVGLLVISGIILGSLYPKKDALICVSGVCFVLGLLTLIFAA